MAIPVFLVGSTAIDKVGFSHAGTEYEDFARDGCGAGRGAFWPAGQSLSLNSARRDNTPPLPPTVADGRSHSRTRLAPFQPLPSSKRLINPRG